MTEAAGTHGERHDDAMSEALSSFGVDDGLLTEQERMRLDTDGVVVLEHHMDEDLLEAFRARYDVLTDHVNLVDKGEVFWAALKDPKLLSAALHVLRRPFQLFAMNGRTAMPGGGSQKLHPDWGSAVEPGSYSIVNSMWMLDDFTEENGSTRFVPGSHRSGRLPTDDLSDPMDRHPNERRLLGPAGSVAIINAHVWHGGTKNSTSHPRRVFTCAFAGREHAQQTVQREALSEEFVAGLDAPMRWLLGVD